MLHKKLLYFNGESKSKMVAIQTKHLSKMNTKKKKKKKYSLPAIIAGGLLGAAAVFGMHEAFNKWWHNKKIKERMLRAQQKELERQKQQQLRKEQAKKELGLTDS